MISSLLVASFVKKILIDSCREENPCLEAASSAFSFKSFETGTCKIVLLIILQLYSFGNRCQHIIKASEGFIVSGKEGPLKEGDSPKLHLGLKEFCYNSLMQIDEIEILKQDDRGIIYRCEPVNYIVRKKGTISADHTHSEAEKIYLVEGKVELTIGKETKVVEAPVQFFVPANEYHKLIALTDIKLIRT